MLLFRNQTLLTDRCMLCNLVVCGSATLQNMRFRRWWVCDVHYALIVLKTKVSLCAFVCVCVRNRDTQYFSLKDPESWLTASSLDNHKPSLTLLLLGRKCSQTAVATFELVCLQVMVSWNSTVLSFCSVWHGPRHLDVAWQVKDKSDF